MNKLDNKTDKDLISLLTEKREALRKFRFGIAGSKVRNMKEGRFLRKEIARVLTELSSRRLHS